MRLYLWEIKTFLDKGKLQECHWHSYPLKWTKNVLRQEGNDKRKNLGPPGKKIKQKKINSMDILNYPHEFFKILHTKKHCKQIKIGKKGKRKNKN